MEIDKTQILLRNTILNENIKKEKMLSKEDAKGRNLFWVLILNASWNNHGSGKAYNPYSGHHIAILGWLSIIPHE
jgi:hypothetical protein